MFLYKVILIIDILRSAIILWILCKCNSSLIVSLDSGRSCAEVVKIHFLK